METIQSTDAEQFRRALDIERMHSETDAIFRQVSQTMDGWFDGQRVWPYQRILDEWGADFEMYRKTWSRPPTSTELEPDFVRGAAMHSARDRYIARYGFAIPCSELLEELDQSITFVVEVGAGSGYMTRLMRNHGIIVRGTDSGDNVYKFKLGMHDHQQHKMQAKTAVRHFWGADTVFCSWPSYDHTWFRQMLKAMQIGQRLVVVRESATGDDTAWEYFDSSFEHVRDIDIPAWHLLHDHVEVAIKKRHGAHAKYEKKPSFRESMAKMRELVKVMQNEGA